MDCASKPSHLIFRFKVQFVYKFLNFCFDYSINPCAMGFLSYLRRVVLIDHVSDNKSPWSCCVSLFLFLVLGEIFLIRVRSLETQYETCLVFSQFGFWVWLFTICGTLTSVLRTFSARFENLDSGFGFLQYKPSYIRGNSSSSCGS